MGKAVALLLVLVLMVAIVLAVSMAVRTMRHHRRLKHAKWEYENHVVSQKMVYRVFRVGETQLTIARVPLEADDFDQLCYEAESECIQKCVSLNAVMALTD